jgi:hypothetical protein
VFETFSQDWIALKAENEADAIAFYGGQLADGSSPRQHVSGLLAEGYSIIAIQPRDGAVALVIEVDETRKWISNIVFYDKREKSRALDNAAKLANKHGWFKEFNWSHGYLFTIEGECVSIAALPDTVGVRGDITIVGLQNVVLPERLFVVGLNIDSSTVTGKSATLQAHNLTINGSTITKLASHVSVASSAKIEMSRISSIADSIIVKDDLEIGFLPIPTALPASTKVGGNLIVDRRSIDTFPSGVTVIGDLIIDGKRGDGDFAVDVAGTVLRPNDYVRFAHLPEKDLEGNQVRVTRASDFVGVFRSVSEQNYMCLIIDFDKRDVQPVGFARMDVVALTEVERRIRMLRPFTADSSISSLRMQ